MIRVLIAEDSPTLQRLIRSVLESDAELDVVGMASNGEEAFELLRELQPDIMTTDIRMPKVNGYQLIQRAMYEAPLPIIALTSTVSDRELGVTFKAIEAGALMVVGKPHGLPGTDPEADRLIDQVKAMSKVKVVRRKPNLPRDGTAKTHGATKASRPGPAPVRIIGLGASTGGPPAVQSILRRLPADFPVPIVVVQHISPGFIGGMSRWLNETTPLRVVLAEDGMRPQPGEVLLAPDDRQLEVTAQNRIQLVDSPPVGGHRPAVNVLFESIARTHGPSAIGIILTGMGSDGARGTKRLHDAGGTTVAQDEASSIIFGMPKQAIALGGVDEVLSLEQIPARLVELVTSGIAAHRRT